MRWADVLISLNQLNMGTLDTNSHSTSFWMVYICSIIDKHNTYVLTVLRYGQLNNLVDVIRKGAWTCLHPLDFENPTRKNRKVGSDASPSTSENHKPL
jgi:hypothetical protein